MSFGGQRIYTLSEDGLDPFLELCPMYGSGNLVICTSDDTDKPETSVVLNKETVKFVAQYLNRWLEYREKVESALTAKISSKVLGLTLKKGH